MTRSRKDKHDKRLCACGRCNNLVSGYNGRGELVRYFKGHHLLGKKIINPDRARGENCYNWKGGRYVDFFGYVLIRMPNHPRAGHNGYVKEHFVIMEKKLGREIKSHELIHHINGNKQDNSPQNLTLVSKAEHCRIHKNRLGKKKKSD